MRDAVDACIELMTAMLLLILNKHVAVNCRVEIFCVQIQCHNCSN